MNGNTITIIISAISTLVLAYTGFKKFSNDSKAQSITGEQNTSNYWEDRTIKMEKRFDILEEKFYEIKDAFDKLGASYMKLQQEMEIIRADNVRLTSDNETKIGRITVLEKQVMDLQSQLDNYSHLDLDKVNNAKASLHNDVENNLNNLK